MKDAVLLFAIFAQIILTVWMLHVFFTALFENNTRLTVEERVFVGFSSGAGAVVGALLAALTINQF